MENDCRREWQGPLQGRGHDDTASAAENDDSRDLSWALKGTSRHGGKTTTAGICQALASAAENDDSRALTRATARQRRKMTTAGFGIGPHKATGPHKGDGTTAPQDAAENDDSRDLSRAQARRRRDNTADENTAENDDSRDLAEALTTATARQHHSQTHGGERRQQGKDPSSPHNDVATTAENDDSRDLSQALASAARTTTAGTCPGPRARTNVPNLSSQ